jgi:hypothetical protein
MLRALILKLACVDRASREWILDQLEAPDRSRVQVLLNEVSELGLDRDVGAITAVLSDHSSKKSQLGVEKSQPAEGVDHLGAFWHDIVLGNSSDASTATSTGAAPPKMSAAILAIAKASKE